MSTTKILINYNEHANDVKGSNCTNQEDKASIMQPTPPVIRNTVGVTEPNSIIDIIETKNLAYHISPGRSQRLKAKRTDNFNQNNSKNPGDGSTKLSLSKELRSKSTNRNKTAELIHNSISMSLSKSIEPNLKSTIRSKSSDPSEEPMYEKGQPTQSTLFPIHPKGSNVNLDDAKEFLQVKLLPLQ